MKPTNKFQVEIARLGFNLNQYNNLDAQMKVYAEHNVIEKKGFATKSRVVCMQCGEKFPSDIVRRKRVICPHCLSYLKVEQSRKTTDRQEFYTAYAQVVEEFQVIRYFVNYCYFGVGKKARTNTWEVLQLWVRESGKYETYGKLHTLNGWSDAWSGVMEIRKERGYYKKYDIYTEHFHPESRFKQMYAMHGINKNLAGLTFLEAARVVPHSPHLETLLKAKQYALLEGLHNRSVDRYWPAIKICIRNKYKIKDAGTWIDYIDLLNYFRKDIRNAHYVCPRDLKKAHDRLVAKESAVQRKLEIERKKCRVANYEQWFAELKSHLTGIKFQDNELLIKTLDSVQEYLEEGDKLKHCVYTNEYFLRPDTLCLSARINNEPIETIEIELKTLKVRQCQGLNNTNSKHHNKILSLVKRNIPVIAERLPLKHNKNKQCAQQL